MIAFEATYFYARNPQTNQVDLSALLPPIPGEQFYQGPTLPIEHVVYLLHPWGNPNLTLKLFSEAIVLPSLNNPSFPITSCVTHQFAAQLTLGPCYQNTTVFSKGHTSIDLVFYNVSFSQPQLNTAYYNVSLSRPVLQAVYCSSTVAHQLLQINSSSITVTALQTQSCLNIYYELAIFTAS